MRDDEIDAILAGELQQLCASTITDADELRKDLDSARKRGWATSHEETNVGLWGIAVTLLDGQGDVVAAVGLAGPRLRLPRARVNEVLDLLKEGADRIASTLALQTSIDAARTRRRVRGPADLDPTAHGESNG
jgi:DNA-binding IclR family transcriptional regulator